MYPVHADTYVCLYNYICMCVSMYMYATPILSHWAFGKPMRWVEGRGSCQELQ